MDLASPSYTGRNQLSKGCQVTQSYLQGVLIYLLLTIYMNIATDIDIRILLYHPFCSQQVDKTMGNKEKKANNYSGIWQMCNRSSFQCLWVARGRKTNASFLLKEDIYHQVKTLQTAYINSCQDTQSLATQSVVPRSAALASPRIMLEMLLAPPID